MPNKWGQWAGMLGATLAGFGAAWYGIRQSENGLERRYFKLAGENDSEGAISALAFEPKNATPQTPAMIVAHGFSASKEIMQVIGNAIAQSGVRAFLFDFAGHGSAPVAFVPPKGADFAGVVTNNTRQVERIYNHIKRNFPAAPLGVLGHSMGSGAIANFAAHHPELTATIPVSPVGAPPFSKTNPKNLLLLAGQRDIPFCIDNARQMLRQATGQRDPQPTQTYGEFGNGTARRMAIFKGLDHISILFAPVTSREISAWLQQSFGTTKTGEIDTAGRLRWMGVGMASAFASFLPFARILTAALGRPKTAAVVPDDKKLSWLDNGGAIALMLGSPFASVLVWNRLKWPQLVRLQLGDYIMAFFSLSGLISWLGLALFGRKKLNLPQTSAAFSGNISEKAVNWGVLPVSLWLYVYFTLGRFSQRTWGNFSLSPARRRAMLVISGALLPYFLADELVCRRIGGWRGYGLSVLNKVAVIAALVLAVRLKPELNFLMILLPTMLPAFGLFGLYSSWQYGQGHDFVTTGVFQALTFGWIISTLFPVI